ncbi:MAG: hypothetical protein KAT65_09995 [Methanophagales archaeon]|nr:hypothetical protein [Methanophagales archaeon]
MTKTKDVIEKIWWVIPPIIVVFGIPLFLTIKEMIEFSQPLGLFIWCYGKNLFLHMIKKFITLYGIVAIFTFGFMGVGYYLSRKRTVSLRILIPLITAFLGYFISHIIALIIIGVA